MGLEAAADVLGLLHVTAAVAALVAGLIVFVGPKGTTRHRRVGAVYVALLVLLNLAALSLHREDAFGPFHVLAVVSLLTICTGVGALLGGGRSNARYAVHSFCMAWSYVGVVAAGTGQLSTRAIDTWGSNVVPVVIGATLLLGGLVIHSSVPRSVEPFFRSSTG